MNRKKRNQKRRVAPAVLIAVAALFAVAGLWMYGVYSKSVVPKTVHVTLHRGAGYDVLLDSLEAGGKITDMRLFKLFARLRELPGAVKHGLYELRKGMSADEAVLQFRNGNQVPTELTFNNIRTMEQLAGRFGDQLEADSLAFISYLRNDSVAAHYGFTSENFIGMFIPNTYEVYRTISPSRLLDRMKREYDNFWKGERDAKIERTGLRDREEVMALASIVMEETSKVDEYPAIAGVYINRIKQGIQLQADPTIIFIAGDPALRRVRRRHLDIESPYNTYKYKGVPPGPIRMPEISAIDAVLNFDEHEYIYFCAKSDFSGYHSFARTLAEHNRNARAYINALDTAGIR